MIKRASIKTANLGTNGTREEDYKRYHQQLQ